MIAATDTRKLPLISTDETPAPVNGTGGGVLVVLTVPLSAELAVYREIVPVGGGTTPSAV